jgi:hypothetical protein
MTISNKNLLLTCPRDLVTRAPLHETRQNPTPISLSVDPFSSGNSPTHTSKKKVVGRGDNYDTITSITVSA